MQIFIDESGSFVCPDTPKTKFCCVAALIVPDRDAERLFTEFRRVRRQINGGDAELKGSQLTERQMGRVIGVLRRFDAVLEVCAIDIGAHSLAGLREMQESQAELLFQHITREHKPTLIQDLCAKADYIRAMPSQLFVQSLLIVPLVQRTLETGLTYFSQRTPEELGRFRWRVDAKHPEGGLTQSEALWRDLIGPMIESATEEAPLGAVSYGDYSHMSRFVVEVVDTPGDTPRTRVNGKAVLHDDLEFVDSQDNDGVQLADILAAAVTRALNDKLRPDGWSGLGGLFVRRRSQTVRVMVMQVKPAPNAKRYLKGGPGDVVKALEAAAKPMLTPAASQALEADLQRNATAGKPIDRG